MLLEKNCQFEKKAVRNSYMHLLCVDDDTSFCCVIEKEATSIDLPITIISTIEQAKQKIRDQCFSACILSSNYLGNHVFIKDSVISLVYQQLPDVSELKRLRSSQKISFIGGKPMSSNEAHYFLSKVCHLSNRLEPICNWIDEIPEDLMNKFLKLNYERLSLVADLIQKAKEKPEDQVWQELQHVLHKISGSAGLYGRSMASELSKEMEVKLKNKEYANLDLDGFYRQLYLYIQ